MAVKTNHAGSVNRASKKTPVEFRMSRNPRNHNTMANRQTTGIVKLDIVSPKSPIAKAGSTHMPAMSVINIITRQANSASRMHLIVV